MGVPGTLSARCCPAGVLEGCLSITVCGTGLGMPPGPPVVVVRMLGDPGLLLLGVACKVSCTCTKDSCEPQQFMLRSGQWAHLLLRSLQRLRCCRVGP